MFWYKNYHYNTTHEYDKNIIYAFLDERLNNDGYNSILDKVNATCSRVEQRLNDKRKVYESPSELSETITATTGITIINTRITIMEFGIHKRPVL